MCNDNPTNPRLAKMGPRERWVVGGEEAPPQTFRPTEAELADWEGLVAAMEQSGAHRAGVARLLLPEGWVPRDRGYQIAELEPRRKMKKGNLTKRLLEQGPPGGRGD